MVGCGLLTQIIGVPGGAACVIAAEAGDLICRSKCPPPAPISYQTLWCDGTVDNSNFPNLMAGIHCGTNPVALLTQECNLVYGLPPILPVQYANPSDAYTSCLDMYGEATLLAFGARQWAICGPQTVRAGWYFHISGGNPTSFCAGGLL